MPVGPRGFNIITNPTHFEHAPDTNFFFKKTDSEVEVYTNFTTGVDAQSRPYQTGTSGSFGIKKEGSGTVLVQVTPNPVTGLWYTIATLGTDPDEFSSKSNYPFVRIQVNSGASGVSVSLWRQYTTY